MTVVHGCGGRKGVGTNIACDPRESDVRQTGMTLLGNKDIRLFKIERCRLQTDVKAAPLSGRRGRVPRCGDTQGRVRHPLAVIGLSGLV